ncbi:MAG: DUF6177 family protein [Phycicoccus sp.]
MTYDLVVATPTPVDPETLLLAVDRASGSAPSGSATSLAVRPDRSRRVLAVTDAASRELFWVGPTRPVARPVAQARRLGLGPMSGHDAHWTEVCVRHPGDLRLARASSEQLVALAGGRVADLAGAAADHDLPSTADTDPVSPFDAVGGAECVLVQRRPVVALGPWLTHALLTASADERTLVVLTPPGTCLTPAVERLVHHGSLRWVVDDGTHAVEPHRGEAVEWDGERFVAPGAAAGAVHERDAQDRGALDHSAPDRGARDDDDAQDHGAQDRIAPDRGARDGAARSFTEEGDASWVLHVEAEALHPYDTPPVGGLAEHVAAALALPPPADLGVLEPGESAWDTAVVAAVAREQAPTPTRLVVGGDGLDGTLSVIAQPGGALERLELLADAGEAPRDVEELRALGDRLLDAGAQLAVVGYRWAAASRLLTTGSAGPLLPALLVAHPGRFTGLSARSFADGADGIAAHRPWVLTFPAPDGLTSAGAARTLRQWRAALALLRRHDTLAARSGRSHPPDTG